MGYKNQRRKPDADQNLKRLLAPAIFTLAFKIIRPILHQATVDKIRIFGYNRDEWVPALLEEIDADQLPGYYGGTMTDPDGDPLCPSKVTKQRG